MAERPFRFGVAAALAPSGEAWLAKARRIEQLGFDALLIPDRLGTLAPEEYAAAFEAAGLPAAYERRSAIERGLYVGVLAVGVLAAPS